MKKRQVVLLLLKAAFAIAVLIWLFHKVDVLQVWDTILGANPKYIICGICLCLLTIAIAGWRWQRLLTMFGIHAPLGSLICIAQIGQFFMMFLPGPAGDDLTRMLYISRMAKDKVPEACTSVLIDRCIGLCSVLMLALLCIPWQWNLLTASHETYWLSVIILIGGVCMAVMGVIFFLANSSMQAWVERCLYLLPSRVPREKLAGMWRLLSTHKCLLLKVITAAFITQLLSCMVFFFAGLAINIYLSPFLWMSFVPIVIVANMVPITLAGLGVREMLLVIFLGALAYVDPKAAVALSFVSFCMILVVSLIGGVVYLIYRSRPNTGT